MTGEDRYDDHIDSVSPSLLRVGVAITVCALLVRGYVCFRDLDQYVADPDAYKMIAETLAKTGVFATPGSNGQPAATAFRPPLYPYLLSWLTVEQRVSLHGIAALHTVLGCVTVLCTFTACRRLLGRPGPYVGIVAAIVVLVDPILLQQSTLVMTETLATALASLVLWWWTVGIRRDSSMTWAMGLGILVALAYLCRPTFLVWGVLLVACTVLTPSASVAWRIRFKRAGIVAAILLLTVGAWTLRNWRTIGHPVWATTHGGYTLLLGNNPMFYEYLRSGDAGTVWDASTFFDAYAHRYDGDPRTAEFWQRDWKNDTLARPSVQAPFTEREDDQRAYEAAKATISRQPAMFVWSCVVRVYRLWTPLPHRTPGRSSLAVAAVSVYYAVIYIAVAIGLWKMRLLNPRRLRSQPNWWAIAALVMTLTMVHAVYWSNMRMRAPAIPALAILVAAPFRSANKASDDG